MSEMSGKKEKRAGKKGLTRRQRQRRSLLLSIFAGSATVGVSLLGYVPVITGKSNRLRPPGALEEAEFLASCIKCGQCVQVCPVEAIKLAHMLDGFGIGVPYINARKQACDFSCDAVQCVLACPTGALSHHIDKKEQVRMGFARLARPDLCLARKGLGFSGVARGDKFPGIHRFIADSKEEKQVLAQRLGISVADLRWTPIKLADHPYERELCDLCVIECPIPGAIAMESFAGAKGKAKTPVVKESCVGCGMCEMICPTDPAAIVIDIRATAKSAGVGKADGAGKASNGGHKS
jgi:ferredoxin-type protein NapG